MIYKFKATIPISKVFMREYAVSSDMNLFRFNRYILGELGFSNDQLVIYKAFDSKGVCTAQYGLFDLGDGTLDKITFADVVARGHERMELVYDLKSKRVIILTFEGELPENPKLSYPALVAEKGHNPSQFANKYEDSLYEKPIRNVAAIPDAPDDEDLDDEDDEDNEEEEENEIYDGGLEDDTLD